MEKLYCCVCAYAEHERLSNELNYVLSIKDYICDDCVCSLTIEKCFKYWPFNAELIIDELNINS